MWCLWFVRGLMKSGSCLQDGFMCVHARLHAQRAWLARFFQVLASRLEDASLPPHVVLLAGMCAVVRLLAEHGMCY